MRWVPALVVAIGVLGCETEATTQQQTWQQDAKYITKPTVTGWDEVDAARAELVVNGEPSSRAEPCKRALAAAGLGTHGHIIVTLAPVDGGVSAKADAKWFHAPKLTSGTVTGTLIGGNDDGTELCTKLARELVAKRPADANPELAAPGPAVEVGVGNTISCSRHKNGGVRCWGLEQRLPLPPANLEEAAQISVGGHRACALLKSGHVRCWGSIDGSAERAVDAREACGVHNATKVVVGGGTTCVLTADRRVSCWPATPAAYAPCAADAGPPLVSDLAEVEDLTIGAARACALGKDQALRCWDVSTRTPPAPQIDSRAPRFTALFGGGDVCGIDAEGDLHCDTREGWTKRGVPNTRLAASTMMATCGLSQEGLDCWGLNKQGEVGDGSRQPRSAPVRINLPNVTHVDVGMNGPCAVSNGDVYCWGLVYGFGQGEFPAPQKIAFSR